MLENVFAILWLSVGGCACGRRVALTPACLSVSWCSCCAHKNVPRVFGSTLTCAVPAAAALPAAPLPTKKSSDKIPSRPASVAGSHTGSHSGSEAV
jgi:hypothetical protein